jgi:hypothetical protein
MFTEGNILDNDIRTYLLLVNWLLITKIVWCGPQLSVSTNHIAEEVLRINLHLKYMFKIYVLLYRYNKTQFK